MERDGEKDLRRDALGCVVVECVYSIERKVAVYTAQSIFMFRYVTG